MRTAGKHPTPNPLGHLPAPAPRTDVEQALHWLDRHLLALGDDITVEEASGTRRYHRAGELFAALKPLKSRVDVGFTKLGRARSKRILAAGGRIPGVRHKVPIEHPGDVDTELLAWLEESYQNAA